VILSQYPKLVTPDLTIYNAAASPITLRLLIYVLIPSGTILLFRFLFFLFRFLKTKGKLLNQSRLVRYEQNRPDDLPE